MRMGNFRDQSARIETVRAGGRLLSQQRREEAASARSCGRRVGGRAIAGRRQQRRDAKVRLAWQLQERVVRHFFHGFGCVQRTFETHRDQRLAVELLHRVFPTI